MSRLNKNIITVACPGIRKEGGGGWQKSESLFLGGGWVQFFKGGPGGNDFSD